MIYFYARKTYYFHGTGVKKHEFILKIIIAILILLLIGLIEGIADRRRKS